MDIAEKLSMNITNKINKALPDKNETELEQIQYGIHILINNIIKLPIVFLIAFFLGILKFTFVAFLSFGFVRCFASGLHARKSITCLLSTMFILLGSAWTGIAVHLKFSDITVAFVTCLILAYFYAPADTEEKPYTSKKIRKKLKILSCISIILLYLVSLVLIKTPYATIITFSVLIECITILPVTYIIFKRRFNNYEAIND